MNTLRDRFAALLSHGNGHVRSIAGQMLSNLAPSAAPKTAQRDFGKALAGTRDGKFVTARHILQSLWKFGLGGEDVRRALLDGLAERFRQAEGEKNGTLVRFDIATGLRALYDETGDETVRPTAVELIALEQDAKYARKYAGAWRGLMQS